MKRACLLAMALAGPATAQSVPEGSAVARVLETALAECRAIDPSVPAALQIGPEAVTWTDLDGDDARDDAIVDFNAIYCSITASLWQGTGGAPIHAMRDAATEGAAQVWTGWNWQVVQHADQPLLLISRHGTACNATGSDPCVMAVTLSDAGFLVVTQP